MADSVLYVLIGLACLLIGGGAGFWFGQTRGRSDAAKSSDLQREFDAYRDQVSEHFGKTADHFQALGVQVRELYDHMAVGAETLCDPARTEQAIAFSAAAALQQATAAPQDDTTAGSEAELAPEQPAGSDQEATAAGEPEEADQASEASAGEPDEPSFTVATPEEDDPDKRSYH